MREIANIEIRGKVASGKTSLAIAIKQMLEYWGINAEITGDSEDDEPAVLLATWGQRLNSFRGQTVQIKTLQTKHVCIKETPTQPGPT